MRQEALERRDAISKKLLAGFEQKASDEDRIIKKAQDERDEEYSRFRFDKIII